MFFRRMFDGLSWTGVGMAAVLAATFLRAGVRRAWRICLAATIFLTDPVLVAGAGAVGVASFGVLSRARLLGATSSVSPPLRLRFTFAFGVLAEVFAGVFAGLAGVLAVLAVFAGVFAGVLI